MVYTYNPSTQETEAGDITVRSKSALDQNEDLASQGPRTSLD